jgi:hypothetical protein
MHCPPPPPLAPARDSIFTVIVLVDRVLDSITDLVDAAPPSASWGGGTCHTFLYNRMIDSL